MTRRWSLILVPALVAGCSLFDTSGVGSGGASVGGDTAEDTGVETTSSADGPGDETSSTTSTSTNDATSTAASVDTTSSSSGTDETSTTTGGVPDPRYPDCTDAGECADASLSCIEFFTRDGTVAHVCSPACGKDGFCPQPVSGAAQAVCVLEQCRLECYESTVCPEGMECYALVDSSVCAYPL